MGIYDIQNSNLILGGNGRGGEVRGYKGSNPFKMRYGYIEIRAKFGKSGSNKGFVNQLWLIHIQDEYEIDITETPSGPINNNTSWQGINKMNSTYHWGNYSGSKEKFYNTGLDLSQDYHTYAVEWTTSYIKFFFDNQETFKVTNNISNLDMYIILGLCAKCRDEEAAGCWSSEECASGDAKLYIDYVKVYDSKTPPTITPTVTPTITPTVTPTITPTVTPTIIPIPPTGADASLLILGILVSILYIISKRKEVNYRPPKGGGLLTRIKRYL